MPHECTNMLGATGRCGVRKPTAVVRRLTAKSSAASALRWRAHVLGLCTAAGCLSCELPRECDRQGEYRCDGFDLERCGSDGLWEWEDNCEMALSCWVPGQGLPNSHCVVAEDRDSGNCQCGSGGQSPVDPSCVAQDPCAQRLCWNDDVWCTNNCGQRDHREESCSHGCEQGTCSPEQPPDPVCVTETKSVVPQIGQLCPTWYNGDKDFDGHGPHVVCEAAVTYDSSGIYLRIHFDATETQSDWTATAGTWDFTVFEAGVDEEIISVSGAGTSICEYVDTNHDPDTCPGGAGPVQYFLVQGDGFGEDVGECIDGERVSVSARFNALQVDLRVCHPEGVGKDDDADGIIDDVEQELALKYAPLLKLHPEETARPASVDWYLDRVEVQFLHDAYCSSCVILPQGSVTQGELASLTHEATGNNCNHDPAALLSSDHPEAKNHFYLRPMDESVHAGSDSTDWRAYAHVKSSDYLPGGFEIQYWLFYAYDDNVLFVNHESDWEHIVVVLDSDTNPYFVSFAQHDGSVPYAPEEILLDGTHPVVYVARGSHASYPFPGTFYGGTDKAAEGGQEWRTWSNLLNVGEHLAPLNGQTFIRYAGRWGVFGSTEKTSGKVGPAFQSDW